jgi:predicted O-methyltransferase YrrM
MTNFGLDDNVKIDTAHSDLIAGLVKSNKPKTILEIGLGGGKSTDAILDALEYNQQPFQYTLVDNWFDWHGQMPSGVNEKYGDKIEIVTSDEREFVFGCNTKFDFIMSDGDHHRTDQWFEYVYANLLNDNGILIYHDVNFVDHDAFHNLKQIYVRTKQYGMSHHLFNLNSRSDERCQRGLLVIFKNESVNPKTY